MHGIIDGVVSMELHGTFPWNSMENVDAEIPMEIGVLYFPWNSMGNVLILHANIFHGNLWGDFHGIPWKLMS